MGNRYLKAENQFIVTRTPLRISLAGGGTDFPEFFSRDEGVVLSTAIDQYVYVTVKKHGALFNEPFRLNYSETELVQQVEDIQNDIARECFRFLSIDPPVYISTVSDLPASSGLGSSGAFAVGLLHALHVYRGESVSPGQLVEEAYQVEKHRLQRPIGKQDQAAAAYGGFNLFRFQPQGNVTVESLSYEQESLAQLASHMMIFWTGITRKSQTILREQQRNTEDKFAELQAIRDHALRMHRIMRDGFDPEALGSLMDQSWRVKRGLASEISNPRIDAWYRAAQQAGAFGGKLCGAGGGGFLLFIVPPRRREAVRESLRDLDEVNVKFELRGSRVLIPYME